MCDRISKILDAAEWRIRGNGYHGFSIREVAADVGIRSASVHYYFPTKEELGAAVARRYRQRFEQAVAAEEAEGKSRVAAWRDLFRRALVDDGRMCLCGMLAVEGAGLPNAVAEEARLFFERGLTALDEVVTGPAGGAMVLAQLEGAMLLARTMGQDDLFDRATSGLC